MIRAQNCQLALPAQKVRFLFSLHAIYVILDYSVCVSLFRQAGSPDADTLNEKVAHEEKKEKLCKGIAKNLLACLNDVHYYLDRIMNICSQQFLLSLSYLTWFTNDGSCSVVFRSRCGQRRNVRVVFQK